MSAQIIDLKSKRTKAVVDQLRAFGVGAQPESSFARTCLELAISNLEEQNGPEALRCAKIALSDIERWVKAGTSPEDDRRERAARARRIDRANRAAATRRIRAAAREREIEELRQKAACYDRGVV
jgi:hypothetical protein